MLKIERKSKSAGKPATVLAERPEALVKPIEAIDHIEVKEATIKPSERPEMPVKANTEDRADQIKPAAEVVQECKIPIDYNNIYRNVYSFHWHHYPPALGTDNGVSYLKQLHDHAEGILSVMSGSDAHGNKLFCEMMNSVVNELERNLEIQREAAARANDTDLDPVDQLEDSFEGVEMPFDPATGTHKDKWTR